MYNSHHITIVLHIKSAITANRSHFMYYYDRYDMIAAIVIAARSQFHEKLDFYEWMNERATFYHFQTLPYLSCCCCMHSQWRSSTTCFMKIIHVRTYIARNEKPLQSIQVHIGMDFEPNLLAYCTIYCKTYYECDVIQECDFNTCTYVCLEWTRGNKSKIQIINRLSLKVFVPICQTIRKFVEIKVSTRVFLALNHLSRDSLINIFSGQI